MKIKILHPIPKYAYFGGEIADVTDAQGSDLVAHGHAIMIPDTEIMQPITPIKAYMREDESINKTTLRKKKTK